MFYNINRFLNKNTLPNKVESNDMNPENNHIAIEAVGLSKCYRIFDNPRDRLRQSIWPRDWKGKHSDLYREFWALQSIDFSLKRGQTIGVMGRNGSGKSTLLQLLCGTLTPTSGEVRCRGRIGALLELGSGFNPEFSGLENVYLNAAILGLKKHEVDARIDNILGFADIGEFVNQPVKTYSSGMALRLAFAVQAHIEPDLLVVDEALAVGDELFQKKCYRHLEKLKDSGTGIILVTHSCPQILQHCDEAILLHKGKARLRGKPPVVTVTYQRLINASDSEWDASLREKLEIEKGDKAKSRVELKKDADDSTVSSNAQAVIRDKEKAGRSVPGWMDENLIPTTTERYRSEGAKIEDVWIENKAGIRCNTLPFGNSFSIIFSYRAHRSIEDIGFACHIANHTGLRVCGQTHPKMLKRNANESLINVKTGDSWTITFYFHGGLWPGVYLIGGGIVNCSDDGNNFVDRVIDFRALRIIDENTATIVGTASLRESPSTLKFDEQPTTKM